MRWRSGGLRGWNGLLVEEEEEKEEEEDEEKEEEKDEEEEEEGGGREAQTGAACSYIMPCRLVILTVNITGNLRVNIIVTITIDTKHFWQFLISMPPITIWSSLGKYI